MAERTELSLNVHPLEVILHSGSEGMHGKLDDALSKTGSIRGPISFEDYKHIIRLG